MHAKAYTLGYVLKYYVPIGFFFRPSLLKSSQSKEKYNEYIENDLVQEH